MFSSFIRNPFSLFYFSIALFFLILTGFCVHANPFTSCLNLHNIHNFTTLPSSPNENYSAYYDLLNFSIQNLRFTDPTIAKPLAIVLPESVKQLQQSVICCREAGLEIRVRCGGHSYEGTSSSVGNDGSIEGSFVIIDMMNLNQVSVDLETETAWVEGGATLGETYSAIAEMSNMHGFSAGSCPTVGVGGHIGGGGFGFLSRKYGLAADNVVDALLVDANGELLNKKTMGDDVFWAIRGGGGGVFGIVYAWKIKLLRIPSVVTNFVLSRPGTKPHLMNLVNKWQHVAPNLGGDIYLSCFVGAGLPEKNKNIGLSATFKGFYLGPKSQALSIIKNVFPELGLAEEDCKEMSWIESVLYFSGLSNGSNLSSLKNRYLEGKNYFKAKSDYVRTRISLRGIRLALNKLEKEPKGYVILDPYGGMMKNISSEAIAFPHREGNIFTIQYLVEWKERENHRSNEYINWIREFYTEMTPFVSKGPRAAYINYMDFDLGVMGIINGFKHDKKCHFRRNFSDKKFTSDEFVAPTQNAVEIAKVWGEKYFLKNYERLVRAKTLIDPDNVFKNQQSIPPSLSVAYI